MDYYFSCSWAGKTFLEFFKQGKFLLCEGIVSNLYLSPNMVGCNWILRDESGQYNSRTVQFHYDSWIRGESRDIRSFPQDPCYKIYVWNQKIMEKEERRTK